MKRTFCFENFGQHKPYIKRDQVNWGKNWTAKKRGRIRKNEKQPTHPHRYIRKWNSSNDADFFSALFIYKWWYVALTFQTLYTKILWYSNKPILPSRLNLPFFSLHPFSLFLLGTTKCATTTNIAHNIDLSLFQSWNKSSSNNNNSTSQKYTGESLSEYTQNERCYKHTEWAKERER